MTTRHGGVSAAPFDSLNLHDGIGDRPGDVACNRRQLTDAIAADAGASVHPVYLEQVHGARVVRLGVADRPPAAGAPGSADPAAAAHRADASVTTAHGIACAVQVADCLPVLFAAPGGVGAAHAGWRGLAAGVLEATLAALCEAAACRPGDVQAWLGACIGPRRFEVGADVLQAFGADRRAADGAIRAAFVPLRPGKWLADLAGLARQRLLAGGIGAVSGGGWCTVEQPSRFFSYRRDGVTGRMVAAVWRRV